MQESVGQGHDYIRTDHLLLGLLRESGGVAARVLLNLGVDPDEALRETREILRTRDIDDDDPLDQVP
jgi:ATP-dependent Clp protease ATP-binding subunit ClpC